MVRFGSFDQMEDTTLRREGFYSAFEEMTGIVLSAYYSSTKADSFGPVSKDEE